MPTTNPYVDKLADIQAHLLSGGRVQTVLDTGTFLYERRQVSWFSADATGLYVTLGGGQGCLNTATVSLC